MKSFFKKSFAVILCAFMLFGIVGTGGSASDIFGSISAEAEDDTAFKTGDLIAFGSYPQSKVTDAALREKLEAQPKEWVSYGYYTGDGSIGSMTTDDYMRYADFNYNGEKYRAVVFDSYRTTDTFVATNNKTSSHQIDNGYWDGDYYGNYYFKYEQLEWRILDADTGLAVCENIIDSQPFNNEIYRKQVNDEGTESDYEYFCDKELTVFANDYENSSILKWLNNDFCNTAFTASQEKTIKNTDLNGEASTTGKVFLLSSSDVQNTAYGFISNKARQTDGSDYAKMQGLYCYRNNALWILSTPSELTDSIQFIDNYGLLRTAGKTYKTYSGIRPALTFDMTSDFVKSLVNVTLNYKTDDDIEVRKNLFAQADTELYVKNIPSKEGTTFRGWNTEPDGSGDLCRVGSLLLIANGETLYADVVDYVRGDLIEYGSYPQSKVTDEAVLSSLSAESENWVSYGYYSGSGDCFDGTMTACDCMSYADIVCNGEKYRAVKLDDYRPYYTGTQASNNHQSSNGYEIGNIYYFKYEPVQWRVLDPVDGLVISESVIDSQPFNNYCIYSDVNENGEYDSNEFFGDSGCTHFANDYEKSYIRAWLSDEFYNTAFSSDEKQNIFLTKLDNSAYSARFNKFDGANTYDKVYLPSYSDMINDRYGFDYVGIPYISVDHARAAYGTDYAICQGLKGEKNGYTMWATRTPGYRSDYFCYIQGDGVIINGYFYGTYCSDKGVRPAMKLITLKNDSTGSKPEESSTYSVTWFSDGKFLSSAEYKAGDTIVKPADPVRSGDTFFGWSPEVPSTMPAKSLTFTAVYDSEKFDNAVIYTCDGSVDYRTKTTFTATATGIPTGYYLAIYGAQDKPITGTNTEVTANLGELKGNKTLTVKIVDSNGNVQTAANGSEISKSATISVNSGFFKKIIAFFRGLFNRLPSVTIKP